jgi:hypothetical protein
MGRLRVFVSTAAACIVMVVFSSKQQVFRVARDIVRMRERRIPLLPVRRIFLFLLFFCRPFPARR